MKSVDYYLTLPKDLSGSISKNRFRQELLWGVNKILDLMEDNRDFNVVFDYVCDIEVHFEDGFEFYQIKTTRNKSYTTNSLVKVENTGSILGKLYVLKKENKDVNVNVFIVSNATYNVIKNESLLYCFIDLPEKDKNFIIENLCKELDLDNIDLKNVFYLHTHMNLENPENEVRGKLIATFEKIKESEPQNPNALYRLIIETVVAKASYEFTNNSYDSLIKMKGITRKEFDGLLEKHTSNVNTGIERAKIYIEKIEDIFARKKHYEALASISNKMIGMIVLKDIENKIYEFLNNFKVTSEKAFKECEIISMLDSEFGRLLPIEITDTEKKLFFLIVLYKWMDK